MALYVDEAKILAFDDAVKLAYQQAGSRLRNYVHLKTGVVGTSVSFNRLSKVSANTKVARHEVHTVQNANGIVSWASPTTDYVALPLDVDDAVEMVDPKSMFVLNIAYSLGVQLDSKIIAAATGGAPRGVSPSTGNVAFVNASFQIAAANTGLTVGKLIDARNKLNASEAPDSDRILLINSDMEMDLLGTVEVTSSDFMEKKVLSTGQLTDFLGFHIIRTELITSNTGAIAYHKMAIGAGIGEEFNTVYPRRDKHSEWESYARLKSAAVRTEDGGVIQILIA